MVPIQQINGVGEAPGGTSGRASQALRHIYPRLNNARFENHW
jgi:hypothetical protein